MPTGYWVGPGLGANELEGEFYNGAVSTSIHVVEEPPNNGCTSVFVLTVSHS